MALFESLINSGKADKKPASFTVTMVHYSKLIPSENNNYSMDSIKELAQMIVLAGGVKQNLLARKKTPDEYDLIAGHRRRQAVKYLVEELGREEYAMMPVHVERDGDLMSEVNLILTNCGARNRSDWERMMEVTRLTDLLKAMQTGSQEEQERFREWIGLEPGLSGRELRKLVADLTGMSETKIAQLNHINNSLTPEMMDKFQAGEIGVSVANEAAGLPLEKQQDLARQETVKLADVKAVSESDTEKTESVAVSDSDTDIPGQQELTRNYPEYCPTVQKNTIDPNIRDVYLDSFARKMIGIHKDWILEDFNHRLLNVTDSEQQYKEHFRRGMSIMHFPDPENEEVAWVDMFDDYIQIWSGAGECLGNTEWFYFCAAMQGMWNEIATEEAQKESKDCDAANSVVDDTQNAAEKQREEDDVPVEEVPEPIEFDRVTLADMIRDAREMLELMQNYWIANKPYIYAKYSMMVQAYEMLLQAHDAVDQQSETEAVEQPELPLFKNNDQRAAFIDAYEGWSLWIDNQKTGERYYRYDMPDGTSFVVKVYHAMLFCGWKAGSGLRYEEGYGYEDFYILEPGKFFRDCRSNKSAMIEKLKEIQKEKR